MVAESQLELLRSFSVQKTHYGGDPSKNQGGHDHYAENKKGVNGENEYGRHNQYGGVFNHRPGAGTAVWVIFAVRKGGKFINRVKGVHGRIIGVPAFGQITIYSNANAPPVNIWAVDRHDSCLEVIPRFGAHFPSSNR